MNSSAQFQLFQKLLEVKLAASFDALCEKLAEHNSLGPFVELPTSHQNAILDCAAKICVQDETTDLRERYGSDVDPIFDVVADLHKTAQQIAQIESALQSALDESEPEEFEHLDSRHPLLTPSQN